LTARRALYAILLLAAVLRLLAIASQDPTARYEPTGGDELWYLANGYGLLTASGAGEFLGQTVQTSTVQTAPLYLVFVGLPQHVLAPDAAILAIWLIQAAAGVLTVGLAWGITLRISDDQRPALLAALALALHPALIAETTAIMTETLYIALVMAGLWATLEALRRESAARVWPWIVGAAFCFGLATLTRAVGIAFPLVIAASFIVAAPRSDWRRGFARAGLLLLVYVAVLSTWTVYNLARWDRFVFVSDNFTPFFFVSVVGQDDPQDIDQAVIAIQGEDSLTDDAYAGAAVTTIAADPGGYVRGRLEELAGAFLQPHGTLPYGGESLRELALDWLRGDRTLEGLAQVTAGEGFWPKLGLYVMHWGSILLGLAGMWLTRFRWRLTLPLIGFIGYTLAVHVVLLALPRYIFPTTPVWWVFAAIAIVALWDRVRRPATGIG
jgi:4-amino-4-deoxy-L-arabinose transferase-like glycosyltransferase